MKHHELLFFPYIEENQIENNFNDNLNFLNNYMSAINSYDLNVVYIILSQNASFIFKDKICLNKIDIEKKFIRIWNEFKDGTYGFENLKVLFESNDTKIITYNFIHQTNKSVKVIGRITNIFMLENNEWKLVNEHLSDL